MLRILTLLGVLAVALGSLVAAESATSANVDWVSIRQTQAATRYQAQISPAAEQAGCEVLLTAELLRSRARLAPRVVRRSVSTTDICATGEEGTSFVTVRASGSVSTRGLPSGRYVFRLTADSAGLNFPLNFARGGPLPFLRVLTVRPTRIARGARVRFAGAGWPPGTRVLVAVGRPRAGASDTVGRPRTDARGRFSRTVRISRSAAPGSYVAIAILPNGEKSSARFRIV